jgi:hypothetical protein
MLLQDKDESYDEPLSEEQIKIFDEAFETYGTNIYSDLHEFFDATHEDYIRYKKFNEKNKEDD